MPFGPTCGARMTAMRELSRATDCYLIHPQRRLAHSHRNALAVLAAGADPGIEREVVADHRDAVEVGWPVADQHRALHRRGNLAVLDLVGLGALEHVLARGDV